MAPLLEHFKHLAQMSGLWEAGLECYVLTPLVLFLDC